MNRTKSYLKIKINPYPAAWCYPGATSTSPGIGNECLVSNSWMAPSDHQTIPEKVGSVPDTARAAGVRLCPPQEQHQQHIPGRGRGWGPGHGWGRPRTSLGCAGPWNTPGIAGRDGRGWNGVCWHGEGSMNHPTMLGLIPPCQDHAGIKPTLPGPAPTAPEVSLLPGYPQGCSSLPSDPKSLQFSGSPPIPDISSSSRGAAPFPSFHPTCLGIILIFFPLHPVGLHTSTPGCAGGSCRPQKRQILAAFPMKNTTNSPFSHRERQIPPGSSSGRAQGEERAAPTPSRVADSHHTSD